MARRKKNPLSTVSKVGLVALIGGGVWAGSRYLDEKRKEDAKKKKKDKVSSLSGVYAENAALAAGGDYIMTNLMYPFDLKVEDLVYLQARDNDGNIQDLGRIHFYGSGAFAAFRDNEPVPLNVTQPAIGHIVTNLTGIKAKEAYGYIQMKVNEMDWSNVVVKDKIITETLKKIAPKANWDKFEPGSLHWYVYGGVAVIGEIANQSIFNKQA